ncbi:hypothetical protein [Staphylococcus carnosus]|nr:hypothetical protein [Staphylococcus carnosus]
MINLFERFNQPTETLYFSMMEAGLDHLTVVLMMMGSYQKQ